MYKLFLAAILAVGLSISASAEQVGTPTMSGNDPSLDYAGVSTCRVNSSTGTTALLCSANPVIVYGVSASSIAATAFISLYSTNSIVLSGAVPARNQFNDNNQTDEDVTTSNDYKFVAPMKLNKGLVIKASAAPDAGIQSEWLIFYREAL